MTTTFTAPRSDESVLADTFYFLALLNPADAAHQRAVRVATEFTGTMLTTEWVLIETADGLATGRNRQAFGVLVQSLAPSSVWEIVWSSRDLFDRGLALYSNRPDKGWSPTDCLSFETMRQRAVTEALTGDHHFEQAGFSALLK
jgi:predicted nucleic acid-binding protein